MLNKGIVRYTKKEIDNISSDKIKIINSDYEINEFVLEEIAKKQSNNCIYFGKVNKKVSDRVYNELNIDISGYNISLKGDNVRKIMKSHGNKINEEKRGQVSVTLNDFNLIGDIISEPDEIRLSKNTKDGKPSITFVKCIKNKYTLVEFVSSKKHNLEVHTLYKNKKKNSVTEDNDIEYPVPNVRNGQ